MLLRTAGLGFCADYPECLVVTSSHLTTIGVVSTLLELTILRLASLHLSFYPALSAAQSAQRDGATRIAKFCAVLRSLRLFASAESYNNP